MIEVYVNGDKTRSVAYMSGSMPAVQGRSQPRRSGGVAGGHRGGCEQFRCDGPGVMTPGILLYILIQNPAF